MKKNRVNRSILVVAVVALVGFSGIALAGPGVPGRHMGYGNADCPRYQEGRGPGWGWGTDLSDEQVAQIEKLRGDFRAATTDLRRDLRQKELSLQAELAKKSPDSAVAVNLQKEISSLSAELDAKRLAHRLEVHKIAPEAGFGPGYGLGPRHDRGGRGPCWD